MRVALVSLDQQWEQKHANLARCADLVHAARSHNCTLAVFPELTLTAFTMNVAGLAEPVESSWTLAEFGELARSARMTLIFGACLRKETHARPSNAFCLARPDGSAVSIYEKIHPFSAAGEDSTFEPGDRLGVARIDDLRIGAAVCYDLRFPELYALMGPHCDAIITIASWPASRDAHWQSLLVARAIENQCFCIGVNRIGRDGNAIEYARSSVVIAPDGSRAEPLHSDGEVDIFEIDPREVSDYRARFPTLKDKRHSLYRMLADPR